MICTCWISKLLPKIWYVKASWSRTVNSACLLVTIENKRASLPFESLDFDSQGKSRAKAVLLECIVVHCMYRCCSVSYRRWKQKIPTRTLNWDCKPRCPGRSSSLDAPASNNPASFWYNPSEDWAESQRGYRFCIVALEVRLQTRLFFI